MGKKVLAAKSGRAVCPNAAAGGGIGAKNAKDAKSFLTGLTGFTGLREASVKPAKTKPSGVAWIGDIPDGWAVRRLKYVASCNDDSLAEDTPSNFSFDYVDVGSVKYGLGIVQREPMVFADAPSRARRVVRKDDVIVSTVRTYLKSVAQIPSFNKPIIVSTGFAVLRAKNSDVIFLNYALQSQSFVDEVEARSTGISYPAINASDLVSIKILLPPLPVQRAIAAYLDEKCGAIDVAIAEAKKGIEEYKAWKKSLIFEVVTGKRRVDFFNAEKQSRRVAESFSTGLTRFTGLEENLDNPVNPVKTKPSGIPWIGDVPVGWEVRRLKDILARPLQYGASESGIAYDEALPRYIRITDITLDGRLKDKGVLSLTEESASDYILQDQDILLARSGATVGKAFLYEKQMGRAAFAGYLIRATVDVTNALPRFVYYTTLGCGYDDWRNSIAVSATIQNIGADKYNNYSLPMPPLTEQRAIVDYLDEKCAAIDKMVAEKNALIADLEAYKKSLIYETVTGKREVL